MMLKCTRCGQQHAGTMMRTDKRYTRVRDMINEEVPRSDDGRLKFCHMCQRSVYFAGGVTQMLIADLNREAIRALVGDLTPELFASARRELGFAAQPAS